MRPRNIHLIAAMLTCILTYANAGDSHEYGKPVAVIAAFQKYQTLADLQQTFASARKLANELHKVGYTVTLVTETASVDQAKADIAETPEIIVRGCDTSADLNDILTEWRTDHFVKNVSAEQSDTPFGLICFSGHGQRRAMPGGAVEFLLAPDDEAQTGGVNVNELRSSIGQRRFPIVLILDCCRTYIEQAERPTPALAGDRNPVSTVRSGSRHDDIDRLIFENAQSMEYFQPTNRVREYPNPVSPVTTYWATIPGKSAAERPNADFVFCLAEGVKWNGKQFYARERRSIRRKEPNNLDDCPLEGKNDLSLASWFKYAAGQLADAGGGALAQPEPGYVDEIMICASHKGNYQRPPVNLLSSWNDFPPTELPATLVSRGVRFSRSDTAVAPDTFAVSFFTGRDTPLEWKDSSLIIDLVADYPEAHSRARLQCLIQPGDNAKPGSYLTPNYNKPYHLPYGIKTRVAIPLEGKDTQELTSLAISTVPRHEDAWPQNATLTVTRLLLVRNADFKKLSSMSAPGHVNLMTRWWDLDAIPASSETTVGGKINVGAANDQKSERPRYLSLEFNPTEAEPLAGRGGPVYAPPYINSDHHQLRIKLRRLVPMNKEAVDPHLTVRVHDRTGRRLIAKEIRHRPKRLHTFEFEDSGFGDYVTLMGAGITKLEIERMEIVPINP